MSEDGAWGREGEAVPAPAHGGAVVEQRVGLRAHPPHPLAHTWWHNDGVGPGAGSVPEDMKWLVLTDWVGAAECTRIKNKMQVDHSHSVCIHMYIYIYIHTYIYLYICIYIYM